MKNRTFLLLVANVLLAMFIILSFENEGENQININSQFSEMTAKMETIKFLQPSIKQEIVLRKNQSDWHIIHPISWPAEPIAIANLISKISHLEPDFICSFDDLESRGEIPQDYGFDSNASSFSLFSSNSELKITLGSLTRDQVGRYLLIDDKKIKTIWRGSHQIENLITRPINEWANLTFFDLPLYAIDEIEVNEFNEEQIKDTTSVRKYDQQWFFSLPNNSRANDEAVAQFLHKLVSEKLIGFAETELQDYPRKVLDLNVLVMGNKHTLAFYLNASAEINRLLVKSSRFPVQAFYVDANFLENFFDLSVKLREKLIFSLEMNQLDRVKIVDSNRSLTLRRDQQSSWVGLEDNGTNIFSFDADPEVVRNFIHKLNTIEVTNFIHFNPNSELLIDLGFENPQLRLEIEQKDSIKNNILISKSNSESSLWNTYLTDQALICLVNTQWNKILSVEAINYKDRRLLPPNFLTAQILIKTLEDNQILSSLNYETHGETFERFVEFKADYFVDLSFNNEGVWVDGDWLPWRYSICFENSDENDSSSLSFNLTDRIGGTRWYAGSEELGLVCNLPISLIDELGKELNSAKQP